MPGVLKRFNGTTAEPASTSAGGSAQKAANLSDLTNPAAALANLGGQPVGTSVLLAGDQTVAGVKTFSSPLIVPDPVSATDAANRQWTLARIADLVNSAPGVLDTLGEIASVLQADESTAAALATTVAGKIPLATVTAANQIVVSSGSGAVAPLTVGASTFVGRKASGNVVALTVAEAKALLAITEADVASLTADLAAKVPTTDTQVSATPKRVFSVTTPGADATPATFTVFDATFNGTIDSAASWGINQLSTGVRDNTKPGIGWFVESDYNDGISRKMEAYVEVIFAGDTPFRRAFFLQADRAAKTLTAVELTTSDGSSGGLNIQDAGKTRNIAIIGGSGTTNESRLQLGFGSTNGAFAARTVSASQLRIAINGGSDLAGFSGNPLGGQAGMSFFVGVIDNSAVGVFAVGTSDPSVKGIVSRGRSSQSGNLFEAQLSTTVAQWAITAAGLPKWCVAALVQTTVGAAGAASAPPASPSKYLKVVGDDGTTYVVPAYAAA